MKVFVLLWEAIDRGTEVEVFATMEAAFATYPSLSWEVRPDGSAWVFGLYGTGWQSISLTPYDVKGEEGAA